MPTSAQKGSAIGDAFFIEIEDFYEETVSQLHTLATEPLVAMQAVFLLVSEEVTI